MEAFHFVCLGSSEKICHDIIFLFKFQGLIHEVFITILRGLSGAKVTKPGKFRSSQDGYAVKSSLKAEDGVLYPLEKSFFFLPKPPTLILHEEVLYVDIFWASLPCLDKMAPENSSVQYT